MACYAKILLCHYRPPRPPFPDLFRPLEERCSPSVSHGSIAVAWRSALALVNVATALRLNDDGAVAEPRIALGAVAPTPMFARKAEVSLDGKKPDEENLLEAARVAVSEIKPIDDFRASANYRRHLVQTLTYRTLKRSAEIASEQ